MRIGIITPAFNVAAYIRDAIGSVLAQTHEDWVMTVVDDGSTDRTASIVMGCGDPRIRLIRQPNAGVSAARDRGLKATQADAVLFLDADDWLAPDALAMLAAALDDAPHAIAAVGAFATVSADGVVARRVRRPVSGDLRDALLRQNLFANGGHVLIRRSAATAVGGFNHDLRYGEDWEYWTRLARLGSFAAVESGKPLLFVRERHDGAYLNMAANPASFTPCMDAIFNAPELCQDLGDAAARELRRRAEAENDWIVGRELIRHGRDAEGRRFLRRSVRAAPSPRRLVLLALGSLPVPRPGPFRRYAAPAAVAR